jgi:hypothetical protein
VTLCLRTVLPIIRSWHAFLDHSKKNNHQDVASDYANRRGRSQLTKVQRITAITGSACAGAGSTPCCASDLSDVFGRGNPLGTSRRIVLICNGNLVHSPSIELPKEALSKLSRRRVGRPARQTASCRYRAPRWVGHRAGVPCWPSERHALLIVRQRERRGRGCN